MAAGARLGLPHPVPPQNPVGGGLLRGVGARLLAEADARLLEKTEKNKKSYNSQKKHKEGCFTGPTPAHEAALELRPRARGSSKR